MLRKSLTGAVLLSIRIAIPALDRSASRQPIRRQDAAAGSKSLTTKRICSLPPLS